MASLRKIWQKIPRCVVTISALILICASVEACRCLAPGDPKEELTKSAIVFSGLVVGVKRDPGMIQHVTFKVLKTWKGRRKKGLVISTSIDPEGCGYEFQNHKKYLVYASKEGGHLQVSVCSRTALLELAGDDIKGFK